MEISDILCEIAQLLEVCGYPDPIKAVRLKQWADDLRVSNSSQQRVEILTKVKNVIAGMNSLSDIYLVPATRSEFSTNKANRKLYCLVADLDHRVHAALDEIDEAAR